MSVRDEANSMIPIMRDKALSKEVDKVKRIDPLESLRFTLLDFFEGRLRAVEKVDGLKAKIQEVIIERLDSGEFDFGQIISLFRNVHKESTSSMDIILSIFKPNQEGKISPLVDPETKTENDSLSGFENLDPEDAEVLDKLTRIVEVINKKEKDKK